MNYEFKKLSEVESLAEVPENATVLAEVDGKIKRIPGSGLGGSGIKTAIIKQQYYDDCVAWLNEEQSSMPSTVNSDGSAYDCINMTFEEAYETMLAGEPLNVILMLINQDAQTTFVTPGMLFFTGIRAFGVPTIVMYTPDNYMELFWCSDGISTEQPGNSAPPT